MADDRGDGPKGEKLDRATLVGFALIAVSAVVYWLADRGFDAGRGDFFYLADAFLHGRTWLTFQPGPWDVIAIDGHYYVPFAPFPAVALMPLVAILGPVTADQVETGVNAVLAAGGVGLCWMLLGRIGVRGIVDRLWLAVLFGFSTQILWVTTRGGVWHTGHLIATILTFAALIELFGKQRAWLIGLLAGAAFLTRAPLAFAIPFYALMLDRPPAIPATDVVGGYVRSAARSTRLRGWILLGLGVLPSIVAFFAYNQVRFGSPWESGYGLASLPPFLEAKRALGLFALAHVPMNIDFFLLHLPTPIPKIPVLQARRPRDVRLHHQSGPPVREPGGLAQAARLVAARGDGRGPHPDPPLLRRRLAPVRLPLLPRFGAVRRRAVRARGGPPRLGRQRLEDAHRVRGGGRRRRGLLGGQDLTAGI